ncbi:NUDIX domain-containing protein [Protofrankia coriariae]|uniref:NUDIX hydrolase n=1 Tax=Protofrankia coriariae TaxID=1562887 RepID=A0ABR5EYV3_9ACTN|nr:NUDIX domain-containing protein [Protofrankia coriariae]KLL09628.1 NUDIX hydrolase [Protofrankia coriariae]
MIEVSARLVAFTEDRLLLANHRGQTWYFLPGGNVEPGESVETALRRETNEETGLRVRDIEFLGCVEHLYDEGGTSFHEINLLFAAQVPWGTDIGSREDGIDIVSVAFHDLPTLDVRPAATTVVITDWVTSRRPSWKPAP